MGFVALLCSALLSSVPSLTPLSDCCLSVLSCLVLCSVFCILCFVFHVLSSVFYVLYSVFCVLSRTPETQITGFTKDNDACVDLPDAVGDANSCVRLVDDTFSTRSTRAVADSTAV